MAAAPSGPLAAVCARTGRCRRLAVAGQARQQSVEHGGRAPALALPRVHGHAARGMQVGRNSQARYGEGRRRRRSELAPAREHAHRLRERSAPALRQRVHKRQRQQRDAGRPGTRVGACQLRRGQAAARAGLPPARRRAAPPAPSPHPLRGPRAPPGCARGQGPRPGRRRRGPAARPVAGRRATEYERPGRGGSRRRIRQEGRRGQRPGRRGRAVRRGPTRAIQAQRQTCRWDETTECGDWSHQRRQ